MKTYNIKLLSDKELEAFKEKYKISLWNNQILVECSNFNRPTLHARDKTFFLISAGRKINITPNIIDLWINHFQNYHLVEIQNYANMLYLMLQNPTKEDIEKIINRNK